jgi:MraZ protein
MFLGQYVHSIDEKGRLTIPARFRDVLAAEGAYLMQGFDQNLMVLTEPAFESVRARLRQFSLTDVTARLLRRLVYSTANRVEVDRVGRILIPQFLRDHAGLNTEAILIGSGEYFEIWSQEGWSQQKALLQDAEANAQRFEPFTILFG